MGSIESKEGQGFVFLVYVHSLPQIPTPLQLCSEVLRGIDR